MLGMLIALGVNVLCGLAAALIGALKGEGGMGLLLGVLLGPIGVIITIAIPGNKAE